MQARAVGRDGGQRVAATSRVAPGGEVRLHRGLGDLDRTGEIFHERDRCGRGGEGRQADAGRQVVMRAVGR